MSNGPIWPICAVAGFLGVCHSRLNFEKFTKLQKAFSKKFNKKYKDPIYYVKPVTCSLKNIAGTKSIHLIKDYRVPRSMRNWVTLENSQKKNNITSFKFRALQFAGGHLGIF